MINQIKTILLLAGLSALFLLIGYLLGGSAGMTYALIFSLVMNVGAYWFSDKIVLAMHQAKPIERGHPSHVYEIVEEISAKADLPMPKVYWVPSPSPNAFATGRNPHHAAVAVTDGILRILNERELRGVLAHEMSHIKNRDTLVSTVAASVASAIMYLAHMLQWVGYSRGNSRDEDRRGVNPIVMLLTIVLAPLAASLIQAAISRAREYMADESGAHVSEDPEALASALEKISNPQFSRGFQPEAEQPAFAHLYIVNHFSAGSLMTLFSTHPPVKDRIEKLRSMK